MQWVEVGRTALVFRIIAIILLLHDNGFFTCRATGGGPDQDGNAAHCGAILSKSAHRQDASGVALCRSFRFAGATRFGSGNRQSDCQNAGKQAGH